MNLSILFLGKKKDEHCQKALKFLEKNFDSVVAFLGDWGDVQPQELDNWSGDYIVSYLSRWIVPEKLIKRARKAAINFHPASPEFPGIGCNNFALYQNTKEYGVTCHHMNQVIDSGSIIAVKRFPILPNDGVEMLLQKTYDNQLVLLYEIMSKVVLGLELPISNETWTRKPFTRKEFNELFRISPEMNDDEVQRRIRAVSYKNWQPFLDIHGFKFEYKP
ncbi:MAG: hypothetical protein LBG80_20615 [Bacteroidales bacterium]|jgi:methionyl-tRNA formyltransferase|nr:hypothetical protein [Bacteroidales bacterium]